MKKLSSLFFLTIVFYAVYSQDAGYFFAEEFYFVKEISAKDIQGKNFRYEIAVHAEPDDSLSKVRIHGIASGKGKEDYLNSNYKVETRTEQNWIIYTVIGTVNNKASRLWFYAAVNGNGNFYFDDINFYVEQTPGHWKQLPLFNASFEEKKGDIFTGYYVSKRRASTLETRLSNEVYKTGKQSLFVRTHNQPFAANRLN